MRRLWRRTPLLPRRVRWALALLAGAAAVVGFAAPGTHPARAQSPLPPGNRAQSESQTAPGIQGDRAALVPEGRTLFHQACSSCHGWNAQGLPGRGPSLHGVGSLAADFYLRTGRMPLKEPGTQPRRAQSPFSERQINALEAYIQTFGGPPVPAVHPSQGDLAHGMELFSASCAGCHQIVGQGGVVPGAFIPDLQSAKAVDVAEAVRIGPYIMPNFTGQFDQHDTDSLARYVLWTRDPVDAGGWGIGHIGPIPEGMVTWLLAIFALVLVIRLIGERSTS